MKTIALITDSTIIEHIFSLLSKKLNFNLITTTNIEKEVQSDIIIVDDTFINDKFNFLKRNTKRLGAISSVELGFNIAKDFLIKKPFMPSELERQLKENIELIDKKFSYEPVKSFEIKRPKKQEIEPASFYPEENTILDDNFTYPLTDYLETLADEIADDIEELNDDSIVSAHAISKKSGILDQSELNKIKEILETSEEQFHKEMTQESDDELDEMNEWCELSQIIDKTIDELEKKAIKHKPLKLLLNDINIEEIKPLLMKLDKSAIEELSNGASLELHIKLGNKK